MESGEDSSADLNEPVLGVTNWKYIKNLVLSFLTFLTNSRMHKFTPCLLFLGGISPWDLRIRLKRNKLV